MKNVIILRGLPGSGKSTWARQTMADAPGQYKRVNKDLLREMLDHSQWTRSNEQFVLATRDSLVLAALEAGKHVIVDDTNLHPKHELQLRAITKGKAKCSVKFFDVPPQECVARDLQRQRSVGQQVIMDMYNRFLKPPPAQYDPHPDLPGCYIFDIDGTLAHMGDTRGPYDWGKVGQDSLDVPVALTLQSHHDAGYHIILMSGRDSVCRPETEAWLQRHGIPYDALYMRPAGDNRPDVEVKWELFTQHVLDRYNVIAVYDDRDGVVGGWRDRGLSCYQVNYGAF